MENTEKKGIFSRIYKWFANLTLKGLLGAILIAFIIIIILMSVSYIPGIMSRISSSLSAALYSIFVPAEKATMVTDKKIINSGENFTISFNQGDMLDGLFTISYVCDPATELLAVENSGLKKIACGEKYYLLDNETTITIRPITTESVIRLVIEGAFENNQDQKIDTVGVARVTITNDNIGTVVIPPTENPPTSPAPNTPTIITPPYIPSQPAPIQPVYYGKPDLAVRIIQTGILQTGTNYIVTNQNQFTYSDMVGIKFEVRNDGDAIAGIWSFTASLPSISTPTYNSNSQISLRPGESIVFTLGFSNLKNQYTNAITINVDPQNMISESVEYNNMATVSITNLNYNSNYYNNNQQNCSSGGYYYNDQWYYTGLCLDDYNYNYNNNWDYNNNYYNYNNLTVTCRVSPTDPETGDTVHWYADAYGGDNDYDYDWTGTNNLNSSAHNPSKTYNSDGWKSATVIVTDGDNNQASATCSVYVND